MSFDKEGNFITQYGERGRSSSEYVRVNSFDVDKHYVYLYDDASEKMISFTMVANSSKRWKLLFGERILKLWKMVHFCFR